MHQQDQQIILKNSCHHQILHLQYIHQMLMKIYTRNLFLPSLMYQFLNHQNYILILTILSITIINL